MYPTMLDKQSILVRECIRNLRHTVFNYRVLAQSVDSHHPRILQVESDLMHTSGHKQFCSVLTQVSMYFMHSTYILVVVCLFNFKPLTNCKRYSCISTCNIPCLIVACLGSGVWLVWTGRSYWGCVWRTFLPAGISQPHSRHPARTGHGSPGLS